MAVAGLILWVRSPASSLRDIGYSLFPGGSQFPNLYNGMVGEGQTK